MKTLHCGDLMKGCDFVAQGATEDQAVAAVKLDQYSKLYAFGGQREVVLRRIYKELKGTLQ